MKNRFNGTYILIMITIILLSFVYFYEIRGKDEREKEKESADRFLIFEPDSVMFIELESNKSHVVIERTSPGKWKLTHPVEAPGDSKAIRSLLESVTTTKIIRTLSANENGNLARNKEFDLSEFGLDHPKIFLDITLSDQQSYELSFGESNPSQTAIYALKSLSPDIFLLPETFFKEVNKKAFQLRDRSVLLFQAADATGFSIHLSDVKYSCYNIIGQWQLTSPFRARAKHDQVKNFLEDLKNAQIKVFVEEEADDLSLYGLDDPEQTITVSLRDRERPIVLQIGDQVDGKEHVYAKDSTRPMVFKIDAELIRERLNIPVDQIEDKRLLNFFSYHIGHILLTLRAGKFEFNKPEYLDWRMSQPDSIRADNGRVDSLLTTLEQLTYRKIYEKNQEPACSVSFDSCLVEIALRRSSQDSLPEAELRIAERKGSYFALTGLDDFIYELNPEIIDLSSQPIDFWRDQHVVRFKRYEVNQVELQWGEKRLAAQKEGTSSWRVQEPVPSEIPRVDMDVVLNQILDLTAISPVQPHTLPTDDQIWGLFVLKTKKETIRFSLYQFDDDRVIGKVETSYYLLEPSLIEMLEKSLNTLDRRVSNPDS